MTRAIKTPVEIQVGELCTLPGTLGSPKAERVAALIVLWHQENSPNQWVPVSLADISRFLLKAKNPCVDRMIVEVFGAPGNEIDPQAFVGISEWMANGWVGGRDWERKGTVSAKFIDAVSNPLSSTLTDPDRPRDTERSPVPWDDAKTTPSNELPTQPTNEIPA